MSERRDIGFGSRRKMKVLKETVFYLTCVLITIKLKTEILLPQNSFKIQSENHRNRGKNRYSITNAIHERVMGRRDRL
jgi:hypothetical protein